MNKYIYQYLTDIPRAFVKSTVKVILEQAMEAQREVEV